MSDYVRETHHEFLDAASEAIQNSHLRQILGRLGDTLGVKNREAWAALPRADWIRERARAIKDEALAELDRHLETLESSVRARGGHVYYADDGSTACEIVCDLIKQRGYSRVVKSKSMTTEEIHLNRALEAAGFEAVETDFGEYIIQVAGHRPSHIVAPAVHLSASDVAAILSPVAGEPLPAEREQLAAFARRQLRSKFAEAEVGITGANFAIAETGSIVLVSNEGNARLTSTMPKMHIAIVGMEKVIPRFADLGWFLKVLARAATGQKISVYTSIITGPRRDREMEGPEEFHLIILDNGRSRILGSPLRESLFCIRCGACLNACPIYRNVGGHAYGGVYTGPIGAVLTPLYDGLVANQHLPNASSLCGACQAACPVKIQIPQMLVQLREQLHQADARSDSQTKGVKDATSAARSKSKYERRESLAYRTWAAILRRPWLYRWVTWWTSRTLGRRYRATQWMKELPGPLSGWTEQRDFPAPAHRRFRDWWQSEGKNAAEDRS